MNDLLPDKEINGQYTIKHPIQKGTYCFSTKNSQLITWTKDYSGFTIEEDSPIVSNIYFDLP